MNIDVLPGYKKKSFNCPNCGAFAHMKWTNLLLYACTSSYYVSICSCCDQHSLWVANCELGQRMLLPDGGNTPMPVVDMPDDVKIDYL